jgi:hypothetical protein
LTTWAVIASGESATAEIVERVRDLPCIAVNNAYLLAPWARAIVANDAAWWRQHPEATAFAGDRWCGSDIRAAQWMRPARGLMQGTNSGLRALDVAVFTYVAKRVLLIGVDLVGRHFHGEHKPPLGNPDAVKFALFRTQFKRYAKEHLAGVEVLNCSRVSTLDCFRKASIDEALCAPASR